MTCFIPNVCKLRVENCGFSLFSEFLITLVHYLAKYLVQMFIELEYPEIVFLRAASWLLVLKMWISFFLSYFNQICELNHRCKMAIVSHEFDIKFTWMKKKTTLAWFSNEKISYDSRNLCEYQWHPYDHVINCI